MFIFFWRLKQTILSHLFIYLSARKYPLLQLNSLKMRRHACVKGRFFDIYFFCYASFNMDKNKEWTLVLPSSFIIHNLGLIVNSVEGSVSPKRPCWSDPVTSYKPSYAALALAIDNNPRQKPQHSPKSGLWASDQRQAAETGRWRPDRNRGVVPERVSTMGGQNEGFS